MPHAIASEGHPRCSKQRKGEGKGKKRKGAVAIAQVKKSMKVVIDYSNKP